MPNVALLPITQEPEQLKTYIEENFRRIAAAMALPVPAAQITPGTLPVGALTVRGRFTVLDGVELYQVSGTPYIDFHRAADSAGDGGADYDIRLINEANDYLVMYGGTFKCPGGFDVNGTTLGGTAGRNWFKDNERSAGAGLRVGAAWGLYGIYSEDGDLVIGTAGARIYFNNPVSGTFLDNNGLTVYGRNYIGQSGAYGGTFAQFSHSTMWNSSGYGYMQENSGQVYLSCANGTLIYFRVGNTTKALIGGSSFEIYTNFALYDSSIYTRAWNDAWHVHGWWSGNDGLRITEYGGLYFRVRDKDPVFQIEAYATSHFERFDQLGGWDTAALFTRAMGGGSPTMISWHEQGRNAAHLIKSWVSALECRSWDNAGWGIFRGELEDYSSAQAKRNIRRAKERLPKADRRAKQKRIEAAHFNRKRGGCANCMGTGLQRENRRINPGMSDHEKRAALPVVAGLFGGSLDETPCPDCKGLGMEFKHPEDVKNEEAGWFGFISEELEKEFPEACYYRRSEADQTKLEVSGISVQAVVALLWEDNKDQQDEIDALTARLSVLEARK